MALLIWVINKVSLVWARFLKKCKFSVYYINAVNVMYELRKFDAIILITQIFLTIYN